MQVVALFFFCSVPSQNVKHRGTNTYILYLPKFSPNFNMEPENDGVQINMSFLEGSQDFSGKSEKWWVFQIINLAPTKTNFLTFGKDLARERYRLKELKTT